MRWIGILVAAVGTWGFLMPGKAAGLINRGLYKTRDGNGRQKLRIRGVALLWVAIGVLIALKG